jgi:hypothetical protein
MTTLMTWMKRHSEVLALLLVIGGGLLAGTALGFVLIVLTNLWRIW